MGDLVPFRPAGPDAREAIAAALDEQRMFAAVALVRTGAPARELEQPLTLELATRYGLGGGFRRAMTALVVAWGEGRDADVLRALAAWERAGCDDCAVAVASLGATGCRRCAAVG